MLHTLNRHNPHISLHSFIECASTTCFCLLSSQQNESLLGSLWLSSKSQLTPNENKEIKKQSDCLLMTMNELFNLHLQSFLSVHFAFHFQHLQRNTKHIYTTSEPET